MESTNQDTLLPEFQSFGKVPRLSREMIVTEKIDGSNGQIFINGSGQFFIGSRNRWLSPENDNFGFCRWALDHREELLKLGPGRHFGEWYGAGIQRGYGLKEKRFALFNVHRWGDGEGCVNIERPACCGAVPILFQGEFGSQVIDHVLTQLKCLGSRAVPGYMKPEGVVIYHTGSRHLFKKTIEGDESPKSVVPNNPASRYGACGQ